MVILSVFVGGAVGAVARYAMTGAIQRRTGGRFPWGTLAVNLLGSALLGVAVPLLRPADGLTAPVALLTVGVLGAFTTFSTLAVETVSLHSARRPGAAFLYLLGSVLLGLMALAGGMMLGLAVARG